MIQAASKSPPSASGHYHYCGGSASRPAGVCEWTRCTDVPTRPLLDNRPHLSYFATMAETETPVMEPGIVETTEENSKSELEPGYLVICWNDPVNFMEYVTHVFQKVFGWTRQKAEVHMLQVHEQGKSILA